MAPREVVVAVVLGASFMGCSALLHPPPQAFSAAPQLRAGASASLLQRVARPDLERDGVTTLDGVERLRGGAGLAKKLGLKNVGMLMVLLSLLYVPRAMNTCMSRIDPFQNKIIRLGCGSSLTITNLVTLAGLGLVLVNSRQFDRHGRSKLKMRLNGSLTVVFGMVLVISHSEAAKLSFYSRVSANLGLFFEWWGFISLFYNFTPRFVAQIPRELGKLYNKVAGKAGMPAASRSAHVDEAMQQKELDRLNRWAQSQQQ